MSEIKVVPPDSGVEQAEMVASRTVKHQLGRAESWTECKGVVREGEAGQIAAFPKAYAAESRRWGTRIERKKGGGSGREGKSLQISIKSVVFKVPVKWPCKDVPCWVLTRKCSCKDLPFGCRTLLKCSFQCPKNKINNTEAAKSRPTSHGN